MYAFCGARGGLDLSCHLDAQHQSWLKFEQSHVQVSGWSLAQDVPSFVFAALVDGEVVIWTEIEWEEQWKGAEEWLMEE